MSSLFWRPLSCGCSNVQGVVHTSTGSATADDACPLSPPSSTPDAGSTGHSLPKEASQQVLTSSYQFIHSVVTLARAAQVKCKFVFQRTPDLAIIK